ncbi:MAG TPA: NAD-dependent epimerase/dehydratase family protein [Kofleriaceae bacterium]|nr:NAD-dependent epimerase/dehydratase family protein [Kofleriaceae bacterium]
MKVFVTGGNGFIGSVVVRQLATHGHAVVCLLRPTSNTDRLAGIDFERADGDVRDAESLRAGMAGCGAVIHLASLSSWDLIDSPEMKDVVLGGTRNVLETAQALGNPRVVFVSSVTAVGATPGPEPLDETAPYNLASERGLTYSHFKHQAEALCAEAAGRGQDVVVVNPAEVYGPNDTAFVTASNLIDFAKSNPVLVCRGGTSVAFVDDVALGIVRAMERGRAGERYILGGPNVTLEQLAQETLDILARSARVWVLPNRLIRAVTRLATGLRIKLPYNPRVIPYATRYWFVDSSKAQRELGVSFRSARATLEPTLKWLREAGHIQ